jgi:hypothetical protein
VPGTEKHQPPKLFDRLSAALHNETRGFRPVANEPAGEMMRKRPILRLFVVTTLLFAGVASASCDRWRIRVRPGAAATLSDTALDELHAPELAHLVVCAETGRRTAHDTEWWRAYRQIVTG